MKIKVFSPLFKLVSSVCLVLMLNGCASEPSPWAKKSSPWDQRKKVEVEAPAADSYKAGLEMPSEAVNDTASEVELSYQAEPVESFAPEASAAVVLEEAVSGEASIMDQPANYYTMQLMASLDIDRVIRFAKKNQVSTQYIIATERDGVIWHVLLLDIYPDYSSAVAARDEITPRLKSAPWIRKIGSVQKLVR